MSTLDTVRDVGSWAQALPTAPKVIISAVVVLLCGFILIILWTAPDESAPENQPKVKAAYERMERILSRLAIAPDGSLLNDGAQVEPTRKAYYTHYLNIASYLKANPGNVAGAYEMIWDNGGESRSFIDDTQSFESVVSAFFREYAEAKDKSGK